MASGWRGRRAGASNGVVRKHHPDRLILTFTVILMLIGLLVIYAIGPQRANVMNSVYGYGYSDQYFSMKQFVSFLLALASFFIVAKIPYELIFKHSARILWVGIGACALLAFLGAVGVIDGTLGAVRWFNLGPLGSIQPAEILKLGVLLFLAVFLGVRMREGRINDVKGTIAPVAIIGGIAMLFVIVLQRDLGTGIALISIITSMLFVSGLSKKFITIALVALAILGVLFVVTSPHRMERVGTFFEGDSTSVTDDDSYHIQHAKIAIGSGGLFGVGIGSSVQASGYLPEVINDSIFAVMGEMFGFIGLMALIGLFMALLMRLLGVMDHVVDPRMRLVVAGVFGWLAAHVVLNIAAMTGLVPLTGITLPFLSYGGTSMIFVMIALGIVYQISRYTVHGSQVKEEGYEDSRSRRGVGRTRHAGRRSA